MSSISSQKPLKLTYPDPERSEGEGSLKEQIIEKMQAHVFLSGRVQGVGMRYFIRSLAIQESLCGFVRNLPDGRVEAVLEGPREVIEKIIQEIEEGEYARYIQHVECDWKRATGTFSNFTILI